MKPRVVSVVSGSSGTDCRPLFHGKEAGPNSYDPRATIPTLEKAHSGRDLGAVRLCSSELPRCTTYKNDSSTVYNERLQQLQAKSRCLGQHG